MIHDILSLANSGAAKTQIVYMANLNFTLVTDYLDFLISRGHVELTNTHATDLTRYNLTERGRRLLKMLEQVEAELDGLFPSDQRRHRNLTLRVPAEESGVN